MNIRTKIFAAIVATLVTCELSAVIFHEIDTTRPLRCTFSLEHQNRVMVNGGRIQKAIFPDGRISVQMEDESGQIFVYPLNNFQRETTLSVVTENGFVQDLEIKFEVQSTEVVILNEPGEVCDESNEKEIEAAKIENSIRKILNGETPEGFVAFEDFRGETKSMICLDVKRIARFEGDRQTLYLYLIMNKGLKHICLHEQTLSSTANWIYLAQNNLQPKEEIVAIVSVNRSNG
jgi:hypothetical protein